MQRKKLHSRLALVLSAALVGLLAGCGGGGGTGSGSGTAAAQGIALPQEVSAISADNGNSTAQAMGLRAMLRAAAAAAGQLPADSDYQMETTAKYVDEPALQVFDIIDTILKATAQTHYADSVNVNTGPYKVLVAWYEEDKGQTMKQVQEWKVESTIDANGSNVVYVWPKGDNMPDAVELKIDRAPTQAADGSYTDYGKWSITAKFDPDGNYYFVATADVDADGMTVLTINQKEQEPYVGGTTLTTKTKAIVHKGNGSGYGQIKMPKLDACMPNDPNDPCANGTVPEKKIEYAYNADYMTYEKFDSNGNPVAGSQVFKDRNNPVEMDYRYGLFDATTGTDVQKSKSFGFPVTYTANGATQQAYYGSWQGLHQLWANGASVPDGTTVTRADVPPDQTAPTYTVKSYPGSLTKRTLVSSDIGQLLDIPVQAFINNNLTLIYNGTNWTECQNPDWTANPMTCGSQTDFSSQLSTLESDPTGQKMVNINGWDQNTQQPVMYAYSGNANSFDIIDQGGNVTGTYNPQTGDNLNVNIGGHIYIEYTANFDGTTNNSGWIQKTLTSFDQDTNTPTFNDNQDQPFDFPSGAQYYLNNNGANFVVARTATNGNADDYTTSMEIQTVANPANAATMVPAGTVFKQQWDNSPDLSTDTNSTFAFQSDSSLPHYLMLVYNTVSQPDQQAGHIQGDVVTDNAWGLLAYDQSGNQLTDTNSNPIQYNWQYAANSGDWGTATYLMDGSTYKLLDDPIMLQPVQLTTNGGATLNFSLQYDGYMHGLPDMHQELQKNNFQITTAIEEKVVNIPAGTYVTDETQNGYFIKPLEIGVILPVVDVGNIAAADQPSLASASQIDLSAEVTAFVDPNVPAAPTGTVLKYIEGNPVQ